MADFAIRGQVRVDAPIYYRGFVTVQWSERLKAVIVRPIDVAVPLCAAALALLAALTLLMVGTSPALAHDSSPATPDTPTGKAIFRGGIDLEWTEVDGADSYDVQLYRGGWIDLPEDGVAIALYGAGAVITGLTHENDTYWFRVRATNARGSYEWSGVLQMNSTDAYLGGDQERPANVPATGSPTIGGTAEAGETLTALTSGIADGNGLDRVNLYYQWLKSNNESAFAEIDGAIGSTYVLVARDQGASVKVRVTFTDRGGYAESLVSDSVVVVVADAGVVVDTDTNTPGDQHALAIDEGVYLLPDLVSDPPIKGSPAIVTHNGQELRVLRFDGYVTNLGDGPLDISGDPQLADPEDPTSHDVWQRVKTESGEWVNLAKPPVRYETADGHNHFHLMEIVAYSLWSADGTILVQPGSKVGFCLYDSEELTDRHPDPGAYTYSDSGIQYCMTNRPGVTSLLMGITEGWRDVYAHDITFQWIDISDVSPGRYRLGAEADPYDIVIESDEDNKVALSPEISIVPGYVAQPQVVTVKQDTDLEFELSTEKYGTPNRAAYRIASPPSHGTLTTEDNFNVVNGEEIEYTAFYSQNVTYTPNSGFSGVDSFEFIAFDSSNRNFPANPTAATVTIDLSTAVVSVSITNAPSSMVAGTSTDLEARVAGAAQGVTWSVDGVEGGNTSSGTIDTDGSYTAPATVPASGSVTIRATSIQSPSAFAETVITIQEAHNTAPSVTAPGDQSLTVGDSVDVHVAATDAESDSLTWYVDTLPAGLSIVSQTGRIVGNPTEAGTTESTVTVTDGELSTSVTITWSISRHNTAPGAPTISGTVKVGETLTADTTGISG